MRIPRSTYSNVAATLALFVALGGTSYAAITITGGNVRNGSLTGSDLKDGSVEGRDVAGGSLTSSDVKNGSLLAGDFKAGELPAGAQGPAGPAGPQGPAGATSVVARRTNAIVPATSGNPVTQIATASCQSGERAVGGGAGVTGVLFGRSGIVLSEPAEDDGTEPEDGEVATKWRAVALSADPSPAQVMNVHVLCAAP
jgi:hypothetical protein